MLRKTKNLEKIEVGRLDKILSGEVQIQLLKIAVEGHELKVLEGAFGILQKGYVKNIVIELTDKDDNIIKIWDVLFNKSGTRKIWLQRNPKLRNASRSLRKA